MEPLNKSRHIQRIDSLIEEYQDLVECGEVAMTRYDYMDEYTDATDEQKWQYINMALERWGAWPRMNYLRNKQRELTCPIFRAAAKSIEEGLAGVFRPEEHPLLPAFTVA